MSSRSQALLAELLALPDEERAEVVALLLEAESPSPDEELIAEVARRAEELRADPSQGLSWEQVREMR